MKHFRKEQGNLEEKCTRLFIYIINWFAMFSVAAFGTSGSVLMS